MRVMSWNLNVRRNSVGQVDAITALAPDVVALQEVSVGSWERLRPLLQAAGFEYLRSGIDELPAGASPLLDRFVVVASRWPISSCEPAIVPAPEAVVCAAVQAPGGVFEVVAVYVPVWTKLAPLRIELQEGVARRLTHAATRPHVLCGDFNSPRSEGANGEIVPFARGSRAMHAELGLLTGLAACDMSDAFRTSNGHLAEEGSWFYKRFGVVSGFRLDHIFTSASIVPRACWYAHELRGAGLSDHSPILADLDLR